MADPTRPPPLDGQPVEEPSTEPPVDADLLRRAARAHGFSDEAADVLVQLTIRQLREAVDGGPVTAAQLVEAIQKRAADEAERERERERERCAVQRESELFDALCERELGRVVEGEHVAAATEAGPGQPSSSSSSRQSNGPQAKRCKVTDGGLEEYFGPAEGFSLSSSSALEPHGSAAPGPEQLFSIRHHGMDLVTALCQRVELAVELAKHLGPEDLVRLYSVSRAFHDALDGHLLSSIRQILAYKAAEAARVFQFRLYRRLLVPDPAGRGWDGQPQKRERPVPEVRSVPGLRYLQLVLVRDRCCRDMLAVLARHGHRTPLGMHKTLLRLWLLMEVSTSHQRRALLRNRDLWTDVDLYNAQFFIVKLAMHFNDPVFGPLTLDMPSLALGQKGLYFLWQVLMRRRCTTPGDILDAKIRYDYPLSHDQRGRHDFHARGVYGVPLYDVGVGHMEGWGRGHARRHLMRPDELVPCEAVVRGLELDRHLCHMMTWGYFDWATGENLVPDEDEMYMSDEERYVAHADTSQLWQKKHALKKRWSTLSPEQQRAIRAADADDALRALAWAADPSSDPEDGEGDDDDDDDGGDGDDSGRERPPTLDDEINRGFILPARPPRRPDDPPRVPGPSADPIAAWSEFGNRVLMDLPVELQGDQLLRAEAFHNYRAPSEDPAADWDWQAWLDQER